MPPPVPGTPATVCIAHPVFLFLALSPPHCRVRLSVSSTDKITIASMFLGPKNATNMGHKNKPALFGEDTGGSKPRKLVLRGTSSHCSDLPLAPRRDAKASPSHLPVHFFASFLLRLPHTHTHTWGALHGEARNSSFSSRKNEVQYCCCAALGMQMPRLTPSKNAQSRARASPMQV